MGGAARHVFPFSFFTVQQTTSGIGRPVKKYFLGLTADDKLNVRNNMLRRSRCVHIFLQITTATNSSNRRLNAI